MKASAACGTLAHPATPAGQDGCGLQLRRQRSGTLGAGNGQDVADLLHGEFGFALRDQFGAAGLHVTFGLIDDIPRLE